MIKIVVKANSPIIFLDVDGVLSPTSHWKDLKRDNLPFFGNRISKACMEQLYRIVDVCDAKVVVTSTWRQFPDDLAELMDALGTYAIPVIGTTPVRPDHIRGKEIKEWMKEHGHERQDFVILDDDSYDIVPYLKEHLFKTNSSDGLTEVIASSAIKFIETHRPKRTRRHK